MSSWMGCVTLVVAYAQPYHRFGDWVSQWWNWDKGRYTWKTILTSVFAIWRCWQKPPWQNISLLWFSL